MKAKILFAPVLLLSLSMACGKAETTSDVSDVGLQNIVKAAQKIQTTARSHPAVADEAAAAEATAVASPGSDPSATPTVNAPAPSPATAQPVPPKEEAPAPTEEGLASSAAISTGNPAIDTICAKSFQALLATTQEELDAVKLTATANATCQKVLLSTGGTLVTELSSLGVSLGLPTATGTVALTSALFSNVLTSNPDYGDLFLQVIDANVFYNETYFLPDANEKLEYVKESIADIKARDPASLTEADAQDLMMLNLSLEVQQGTVDKFNLRITKLNNLANYTSLAAGVGYVGQVLAAAAAI